MGHLLDKEEDENGSEDRTGPTRLNLQRYERFMDDDKGQIK